MSHNPDLHVGITGGRSQPSILQLHTLSRVLDDLEEEVGQSWHNVPELVFHLGDCVGADAAVWAAVTVAGTVAGYRTVGHPPTNTTHRAFCEYDEELEPLDYPERNHAIVNASNVLIAMPDRPETLRSGTWATVRYARSLGRPITVITRDGVV